MFSGVLLFDLSAAYDVLDIEILLKKASNYGLDHTSQAWLKSYLTNRSQAVKVGTFIAEPVSLPCGIPQGSSISCLLFIIYIADIGKWTDISIQGFADDTLIFCQGKSAREVISILKTEAEKILQYFASNELVANPTKTAFLLLCPSAHRRDCEQVRVGDAIISESKSEKVLGVQITSSLSWKKHTEQVLSRMTSGIYSLKRLQPLLCTKHLKMIADGLVMAHARYCAPVYLSEKIRLTNDAPLSLELKRLQVKQNSLLRTLLKIKKIEHVKIADMLQESQWLSINQMACYTTLIEAWKSHKITGVYPNTQTRADSRTLRSDTLQLLRTNGKNPESFLGKASKLLDMASQRLRSTNLLKVAKMEAMTLCKDNANLNLVYCNTYPYHTI